jgi:hypothetical protein
LIGKLIVVKLAILQPHYTASEVLNLCIYLKSELIRHLVHAKTM